MKPYRVRSLATLAVILCAATHGVRAEPPAGATSKPAFIDIFPEPPMDVDGTKTDGRSPKGEFLAKVAQLRLKVTRNARPVSSDDLTDAVQGWLAGLRWRSPGGDRWFRVYFPVTHPTTVASDGNAWIVRVDVMALDGTERDAEEASRLLLEGTNRSIRQANESLGAERQRRVDSLQRDRAQMEAAMRAQRTGDARPDPATASVEQEDIRLRLALIEKQARIKAISDAVEELRARARRESQADPVAEEYRNIVRIAESRVALVREGYAKGVNSNAEVTDAMEKLSQAKAQLAMREGATSKANKGEILDRLADEQTYATIDVAALVAQRDSVRKWLDELREEGAARAEQARAEHVRRVQSVVASQARESLLLSLEGVEVLPDSAP